MTQYRFEGKLLTSFPANLSVLDSVEIETIELPGWKEDIRDCRSFDELPENAQHYCREIERLTEVPFILLV